MPRKSRQTTAAAVKLPVAASEQLPAPAAETPTEAAPSQTEVAPASDSSGQHKENTKEFKQIQHRVTSSLAGVKAGMNFKFNGQPFVEFTDDRPPTAEEKQLLDSQGENDPRFRYRGTQEKRWTGPSTPEARDKAISVAQKIKEDRLKADDAKAR